MKSRHGPHSELRRTVVKGGLGAAAIAALPAIPPGNAAIAAAPKPPLTTVRRSSLCGPCLPFILVSLSKSHANVRAVMARAACRANMIMQVGCGNGKSLETGRIARHVPETEHVAAAAGPGKRRLARAIHYTGYKLTGRD